MQAYFELHLFTRNIGSALVAILPLCAGCEVASPIVSAGKDTYVVSSHVGACVHCSAAVTGLQAANKFCSKMGKVVLVRNTEGYTNPFGYDTSNQLIFSCLDESDAEYKRPNLRKDNGVTTIEKR
jgi:hypothetical protein